MKKLAAYVAILFLLLSCGRYEDGPLISLRSHKKRNLGTFEVEQFFRNGQDITEEFQCDSAWIETFNIELRGNRQYPEDILITVTMRYESYTSDRVSPYQEGLYRFGPINVVGVIWSTTRLTYREKWMKTTYQGNEYKIHFKRKQ